MTKQEYAIRDLLRAIFGNKRDPRIWKCCGFIVAARTRKNARKEFERKGIAKFHVSRETRPTV